MSVIDTSVSQAVALSIEHAIDAVCLSMPMNVGISSA